MDVVDREKSCGRCGYTWNSHTDVPIRCPHCGTYHWQGKPQVNTCAVCHHCWYSRGLKSPLRCPSCKTRSWIRGPRGVQRSATTSMEGGNAASDIVDRYLAGNGCVSIAMETGCSLSMVVDVVRTAVTGESPRM